MKNISYTQMRTELSAILDILRQGESVTITQRGKPDIVISATGSEAALHARESSRDYTVCEQNTAQEAVQTSLLPDASGQCADLRGKPVSDFREALARTRIKHADIIRALEDK